MNYEEIKQLLPQKSPFIFVDRILQFDPGREITCLKNVTGNESFFIGHFPDFSIMPGALIIEALAQSAVLLFRKSHVWAEEFTSKVFVLRKTNVHFLHPVFPGDQLILQVLKEKMAPIGAIVTVVGKVEDKVVAKGSLTFGAVDRGNLMGLQGNEASSGLGQGGSRGEDFS